jgi:hypothetical protein
VKLSMSHTFLKCFLIQIFLWFSFTDTMNSDS